MKPILRNALLTGSFLVTPLLHGAVLVNSLGTYNYAQNFDGLDVSADVSTAGTTAPIAWTWTNDSTYDGWTRQVAIGATTNRMDKDYIGEFTSGTIRFGNMGDGGSFGGSTTDRALGILMQGNVDPGGNSASFGVIFEVAVGLGINSATVSYTGEQWFRAATAETMDFQYKILNSYNAASFAINEETAWTDVNALDFSTLQNASNQKINGNNASNRSNLSSTFSLSASQGQFVAFRWNYTSDSTAAQAGLAVDDLTFSFTTVAVPEPGSALLVMLGSLLALRRSRV